MKKKIIIALCALTVLIGALIIVQRVISKDPTVKEPATTGKGNMSDEKDGDDDEESGQITFYFSCADMGNPYYAALEASLRYEAAENDAKLVTLDAQSDQEQQNSQLTECAENGADVILFIPVTPDGANEVIGDITADKKIPVVGLDSKNSDPSLLSCFIGADHEKAGSLAGKDLIKRAPKGGSVIILESLSSYAVSDSVSGFEHTIAGSGFTVSERHDCQGSQEQARQYMAEVLTRETSMTAVMCGEDSMALGVAEALTAYNSEHPDAPVYPLIYSVGGYPAVKELLASDNPLMTATAAISPLRVGQDAAVAALSLIESGKAEEEILEPPYLVNRNNIKLYGTDGWQ